MGSMTQPQKWTALLGGLCLVCFVWPFNTIIPGVCSCACSQAAGVAHKMKWYVGLGALGWGVGTYKGSALTTKVNGQVAATAEETWKKTPGSFSEATVLLKQTCGPYYKAFMAAMGTDEDAHEITLEELLTWPSIAKTWVVTHAEKFGSQSNDEVQEGGDACTAPVDPKTVLAGRWECLACQRLNLPTDANCKTCTTPQGQQSSLDAPTLDQFKIQAQTLNLEDAQTR